MPVPTKHVNYNQIASTYDQRYHHNKLLGVETALLEFARENKAQQVLEVGCGTGRWLGCIESVALNVFGVDLSPGMLEEASRKSRDFHLTCSRAEEIPYRSQSFDLVFCINALHHFDDPRGFIAEAKRLLKPGGTLIIIGQIPQDRRNHWFVYDYFDGTYETDLKRFPTWNTVMDWMEAERFEQPLLETVEQVVDHKFGSEVLNDPFLKKEAISQLALLSDEAYEKGMERIRKALSKPKRSNNILTFQVELRLDMLAARKPVAIKE
jgi:ubiquinone/menaquinone biosynthesis C-methylase UbiE